MVSAGDGLWIEEQPMGAPGVTLRTRMVVARLADGSLWVHSPLTGPEELYTQMEALGPVRHLVAPNRFHYRCMKAVRQRFPEARVFASPKVLPRMAGGPTLPLTGELPQEWESTLQALPFEGHRLLDEVLFLHRPTATLITADLLMSTHAEDGLATRMLGKLVRIHEVPAMPVELRWAFHDRKASLATIERLLEWEFNRVIYAHGHILETGGRAAVERAYEFLRR